MMSQTINFPSLLKWWLTLLLGSVATVSPCDCFGLVIRYFRDYATDGSWPTPAPHKHSAKVSTRWHSRHCAHRKNEDEHRTMFVARPRTTKLSSVPHLTTVATRLPRMPTT